MTITQTAMALGNWSVKLRADIPRSTLDAIQYFGHVAILTGRTDPRVSGDSLLTSARYVGVLRGKQEQLEGWSLSGAGMAYWIGDESDKGPVITNQLLLTSSTFTNAVNQCLAAGSAVVAGNLHSVTGAYSGVHQWQTTRKAITYICATMTSDFTNPVEWRVNGDATLDAGYVSDLYVTNPVASIVRQQAGADMTVRALAGKAITTSDVTDFRTRQILLAQGGGLQLSSGVATIAPGLNPYKDLRGNPVAITATSSESSTNPANANARAAIVLSQYQLPRQAVQLSTSEFDVAGDVAVGDWVWVHDPDAGLVDTSNELVIRGERINPMKLRVKEMTWPVTRDMAVAYRDNNGNWYDLTDYVVWESGDTHIVVGGYDRSLINPTGMAESLGSRAMPNTTIPNTPAFSGVPWNQAVYQSANSGITKAQVQVTWTQPTNTDGSAIIDGDHYEIQYRPSSTPLYPATWAQLAAKTYAQLNTWGQPIAYQTGPWQIAYARWDTTAMLIQELTPGIPYEFQVRALDNGIPPNASPWSASTVIQTAADTIPPSPPAAPVVASSRIAVQITHSLGKSSGGTFNLEPDLHHLEIHAQYEPLFTPTPTTLLGKLICNNGMMMAQIPAVGTFPVESVNPLYFKCVAVDEAGNKSGPSTAAQATAKLIDDAHISDLTVSKVTAGTIRSDFVIGARIKTADTGARVELNSAGLQAYDTNNAQTVAINSADGSATFSGTIGGSGLNVGGGSGINLVVGGVTKFHTGSDRTVVRDAANDIIISDDIIAGWGLTQPNLQTAFYQVNSASQVQTTTADNAFYPKWVAGHIINHPRVVFGIRVQINFNPPAAGGYRVMWYTSYPPNTANPSGGTVLALETGLPLGTSMRGPFIYDWPANMFGQVVYISVEPVLSAGVSGTDWVSAVPYLFYGSGR